MLVDYYGQPDVLYGIYVAQVDNDIVGMMHFFNIYAGSYSGGSLRMLRRLGVISAIHAIMTFTILNYRIADKCYIEQLAVTSAFRSRGIGKQLLIRGKEIIKEKQETTYPTFIAADNNGSSKLKKWDFQKRHQETAY